MAHYAFLNENNIVVEVIVGKDENDGDENWEQVYGSFRGLTCKRCSYNTIRGQHINNGTPFRKNYPGNGFFYDEGRDAFIPPKKPHESNYVLNEDMCIWIPPVARPDVPLDHPIYYNPVSNAWEEFTVTDAGMPQIV
jgi:hypothetical protein